MGLLLHLTGLLGWPPRAVHHGWLGQSWFWLSLAVAPSLKSLPLVPCLLWLLQTSACHPEALSLADTSRHPGDGSQHRLACYFCCHPSESRGPTPKASHTINVQLVVGSAMLLNI